MKKVNVVEIGPRDGFQSISCMQIPVETKKQLVDFTPVDYAAKAVIELLDAESNQIIYHLYNNKKVRISDIVDVVAKNNYKIRFGDSLEVRQAIYNNLEENESKNLKGILVDVTSDEDLKYVTGIEVTNDISTQILENKGFRWPNITEKYLDRFIKRIMR